ncbi:MAG: PAS domain-containing protein [Deferribacteraceae bacterium]|nr:PAS domain-containing protein [Deferribacteraceae bacterium]
MTNNLLQGNPFLTAISVITQTLGFPVLFYDDESGCMLSLHKGDVTETEVPDSIKPYLNDQNTFCTHFSQGGNRMVIYFIRIKADSKTHTVIVQDNKKRARLNRFISALFTVIGQPSSDFDEKNIEIAEKDGIISLLEHRVDELSGLLKEKDEDYSGEIKRIKTEFEIYVQNAETDITSAREEKKALEEELVSVKNMACAEPPADKSNDLRKLWEEAAMEELARLRASAEKTSELENQINSLKTSLADRETEVEKLSAELEQIKNIEILNRMQPEERDAVLLTLQEKNKELENAYEALKKDSEQSVSAEIVAELTRRLDAATNENETVRREICAAKKELEELGEQVSSDRTLTQTCEILRRELENANKLNDRKDENYENALKTLVEMQASAHEKDNDISSLRLKITEFNSAVTKYEERCQNMQNLLDEKESLFSGYEQEMCDMRKTVEDNTKQFDVLAKRADSATDLSNMLRKSRDKLSELINGLSQPIFSVNRENKVVTINKALTAFCGAKKATDVVGGKCYETVYKIKNECSWCMLEQVRSGGEPVQISVVVSNDNSERHLDILFLPIFDSEKNLTEVAEFITDKTESVELAHSLIKFKEKLRDFKKARIEDMHEVSEVKKAYQELFSEHEHLTDKNSKMLKLIERLVSEDKAKELLNVRTELMEFRSKLMRANETIKNYKYQLDEQLLRYSDLNRRTFSQMERLLNIMKSKTNLKGDETSTILNFLVREFELVKKHFIDTKKKEAGEEKNTDFEEQFRTQAVFKSEEEKRLQKRLAVDRKSVGASPRF